MLRPRGLVSESSRVCLRRCHCAPSGLKGPEAIWIVAIPCAETAFGCVPKFWFFVNSDYSRFWGISQWCRRCLRFPDSCLPMFRGLWTRAVLGIFLSLVSEVASLPVVLEQLLLHVCRSDSIFSLISVVVPLQFMPQQTSWSTVSQSYFSVTYLFPWRIFSCILSPLDGLTFDIRPWS